MSIPKKKTIKNTKTVLTSAPETPISEYIIILDSDCDSGFEIIYKGKEVFTTELTVEESSVSCGVQQVYELPTNADLNNLFSAAGEGRAHSILKEAYNQYFERVKKEYKAAFLILSNCCKASDTRINNVLDKLCASTNEKKNPNTSNKIKVWIY